MSKLFLLQAPEVSGSFLQQVATSVSGILNDERSNFDDGVKTIADKTGLEAGEKLEARVQSVSKQKDQLDDREKSNSDDLAAAGESTTEIENGLKTNPATEGAVASLFAVREKAEASEADMLADNVASNSARAAELNSFKVELLGDSGLTGTIEAINAALGTSIGDIA
jgi:hypothetical protein